MADLAARTDGDRKLIVVTEFEPQAPWGVDPEDPWGTLSPGDANSPPLVVLIYWMSSLNRFIGLVDEALYHKRRMEDPAYPVENWAEPVRAPDWVRVRGISMNSPLTLELIVNGVSGAGVVTAVVYLFKNPDKIGEWFPKLQTSWYNGRAEAEKARTAYQELHEARTQIRELER
ncbi:hypothetical protein [Streptosporangium subroseum]|uniref:hypothetical protein n=1 Tax=Streptosporangium subroseum TaxID=106412 RepID=UPI0030875EED|nr:hypothetical protein OHB15_14180 [Streptosporangium subroseum]